MELKKAEKKRVKLRIGIAGASGFGKTYSALLLAFGMTNDWSKIAVIDTENESASLYSDLGEYNVLPIAAPFTPEIYIDAIKVCENAGIQVIIIDSISHEREGRGGCLEIVDIITQQSNSRNSYTAWGAVTPRHNSFIQTILQSKCHIITTVRKKQDYDMVKNDKGKTEIIKLGTKEVTREGFEYELTINFELLNEHHLVKLSKNRTSLFKNDLGFIITSQTGKDLVEWANTGIEIAPQLKIVPEKIFNKLLENLSTSPIEGLKWLKDKILSDEQKTIFNKVVYAFCVELDITVESNVLLQNEIFELYQLPEEMIEFLKNK